MKIVKVKCRTIVDSRAEWAVEADVYAEDGSMGRCAIPYGKSRGKYEAKIVAPKKAVENIHAEVGKEVIGLDVTDQEALDEKMRELDGTPDKSRLGANAILPVSLAAAKCAANVEGVELFEYFGGLLENKDFKPPVPLVDILMGGLHRVIGQERAEKVADNFQNTQLVFIKAKTFREATEMGRNVYHALRDIIIKEQGPDRATVGEDGGFAAFTDNRGLMELAERSIENAGYNSKDVGLFPDAAASHWLTKDGKYTVDGKVLSTEELLDFYLELIKDFNLYGFEDPFGEDDLKGYQEFMKKVGDKIIVQGDDWTVTNPVRLKSHIENKACNSLLIKLNQIGTLSEGLECIRMSLKNDIVPTPSHRSGETEDTFVSDLAASIQWKHSKFPVMQKIGAPCKGERTCKYNRNLRIEEMLAEKD
ncbi:MAG: phosphopyruvate hydratase [Candidatus Altiarchaeota archaeon]